MGSPSSYQSRNSFDGPHVFSHSLAFKREMAQVSARMAAALARQAPKAAQVSKQVPALSVAARQLSTSSQLNGAKAASGEISSKITEFEKQFIAHVKGTQQ